MTPRLISSQAYRDEAIISAKREAQDYTVRIAWLPELGEDVAVILDGHHSLCAAILDGAAPVYVVVSDADTMAGRDDMAAWLERHIIDGDYRWVDADGYQGATVF